MLSRSQARGSDDRHECIHPVREGPRVDRFRAVGCADPVSTSSIVASELLVGVHRAKTEEQRERRRAFVETVLAGVEVLAFTEPIARLHAQIQADLMQRGEVIGSHDLIIAATAMFHSHSLLTDNVQEFLRVPGLQVIPFQV